LAFCFVSRFFEKKRGKKLFSHGFGETLFKSLALKLCHTPFYVGAGKKLYSQEFVRSLQSVYKITVSSFFRACNLFGTF